MERNNNSNNAFAEGGSSLFIIETPFQAMCAISAIRQLRIEDYTLSLHLHPSTEKRNNQTIELVKRYGMKYNVFKQVPVGFLDRINLIFNHKGAFSRVFLGTHLYQNGFYYALKELKRNSSLVLLDDGIATLTLLHNGYKITGRSILHMAFYKVLARLRDINFNNIFTVYKDVTNPKWNIKFNDISMLRLNTTYEGDGMIFFIGTNNSGFIREGINEKDFKSNLLKVLKDLKEKYPMEDIIYIPHGRDRSLFAKEFCEDIGIKYNPVDVNVEIHILSLGVIPKAIYGFTSSALYNLKQLFPETSVNNIVMGVLSKDYPNILYTSDYYEKQGITKIRV